MGTGGERSAGLLGEGRGHGAQRVITVRVTLQPQARGAILLHSTWDGSLNFKEKVYTLQRRDHWLLLLSHHLILSEGGWNDGERGTWQSWLSCVTCDLRQVT